MINKFQLDNLVAGKDPEETVVVVAMSGGVDSSVIAALLHKLGYKVIGITMQLYSSSDDGFEKKGACCGGLDIYDAKRVASKMGFPHYVLNYEQVFKKEVIDDFINSYMHGYTPVPCIRCNQTVKFRDLLQATKNLGADVLVTGHYIRKVEKDDDIYIYSSKDLTKDQSYFLFATTIEQLRFLRFPLGNFYKSEVRELAKYLELKVAEKPDSQDICFVSGTYKETILNLKPKSIEKGKIVHVDGTVLGEHNGIINFTIGQRRGIGLSSSEPLYVVKIDADTQEVTVGPKSALLRDTLYIEDLNWLSSKKDQSDGLSVKVKLRSSHMGSNANIYFESDNKAKVVLQNSYCAITPGQACVVYDGDRMLGGGWICK